LRGVDVERGPMYNLEWSLVATLGPLLIGAMLIYLVLRRS